MALAGAGKLGLPKLHGAMAKALFGKKNVHGATRQGGGGRRLSLANAPSQRDARPLLKHKLGWCGLVWVGVCEGGWVG